MIKIFAGVVWLIVICLLLAALFGAVWLLVSAFSAVTALFGFTGNFGVMISALVLTTGTLALVALIFPGKAHRDIPPLRGDHEAQAPENLKH